jgi:hypothetical protein
MVKLDADGLHKFTSAYLVAAVLTVCTASLVSGDVPDRKSIEDNPISSTWLTASAQGWVGKQLVFLEIPKQDGLQEYTDFLVVRPPNSKRDSGIETKSRQPIYQKFVGKTVTVTKFLSYSELSGKASVEVVFLLNEPTTNTNIAVMTSYGLLHHLADATALQAAKDKWLDKTIYAKDTHLYQYDAKQGLETLADVPSGQPLYVTDVVWGMDESNPIWVVVKTDAGRRGYYQVSEGHSPVSAIYTAAVGNEGVSFFDTDPKLLAGWSASVLDDISSHRVSVGMTGEQVTLSVGNPDKINKDMSADSVTEQWVYPHKLVYLHYGKVTDVQDL